MSAILRARLASPPVALLLALGVGALAACAPFAISPVTAAVVLPTLAAAAWMLVSPRRGALAFVPVITLLPYGVVPLRFEVQLRMLDVVILCLAIGWLIRAAERRERIELPPAAVAVLIFCALAVTSFVLSASYAMTAELTRRFLKLLAGMLFFVVALNLVRDRAALESHVRAFMLCGAVAAAVGLTLFLLPPWRQVELLSALEPIGYPSGWGLLRYLPGPNDTYTEIVRAIGTSVDPNVFAAMLLVTASLILAQLLSPRPLLSPAVLVPLGVIVVACMLATHSRATWLGLAAGAAWIATLHDRRAWLLGAVGAVLVAFTPLGQSLLGRVLSGFAAQDKAAALRVSEYANAFEIIRAYPVFGIGFGAAPRLGLFPGVSSQLLLVAEQVGLVGLVAYVTSLAGVLLPSLRPGVKIEEPRLQGVVTALQTGLVAALVAGLFDHYWANTAFQHAVTLFWYLCALVVRSTTLSRANAQPLPDVQHLDRS